MTYLVSQKPVYIFFKCWMLAARLGVDVVLAEGDPVALVQTLLCTGY